MGPFLFRELITNRTCRSAYWSGPVVLLAPTWAQEETLAAEGTAKGPGGRQPDFKKGWESAAPADDMKLADQSETATPASTPDARFEDKWQAKAAEILKDAAEKDVGSAA